MNGEILEDILDFIGKRQMQKIRGGASLDETNQEIYEAVKCLADLHCIKTNKKAYRDGIIKGFRRATRGAMKVNLN